MKTLIVGAGPIGMLYTHRLLSVGNDVTVLARGAGLSMLQEGGVKLVDGYNGEESRLIAPAVAQLSAEDDYDLAIVAVRKNSVAPILDLLSGCPNIENILFIGNNVLGFNDYLDVLPKEKVLFGFPGAGGGWSDDAIEYVDRDKPGAKRIPIRIGEIDGVVKSRTREIRRLFERSGVPAEVVSDIDGWLKYHAAFVVPIGLAIYIHGCDPSAAAGDPETMRNVVRASKELGNVLRSLGYRKRQPFKFNLFYWMPENMTAKILAKLFESPFAEIALAMHAASARDEFQTLTDELRLLAGQAGVDTPVFGEFSKRVGF